MRQVLFAGEKAEEWTALVRIVVSNRSAQHGIAGLERVQNRPERDFSIYFEFHVAANLNEGSEVWRQNDADHIN
jgi:hypothetical protein